MRFSPTSPPILPTTTYTYLLLLLLTLHLHSAHTHPSGANLLHKHLLRRQDWSNPNLYNVDFHTVVTDWKTVNYGGNQQPTPVPSPHQPAAAAAVNPPPANNPPPQNKDAAPKTEQKNTDSKPKDDDKTPAYPPASSGSGYTGPKRGLAYNHESPPLSLFSSDGQLLSSWCYNWNSAPASASTPNLPSTLSYAPMLHSLKAVHTDVWRKNADAAIAADRKANRATTWLLGFNEPDIPDQANLDVGAAIGAWKQYMQPYAGKDGIKLGSPAVSNAGGSPGHPQGLTWLKQFLQGCQGCQVDFLVVHWYGCTDVSCPSGCSLSPIPSSFHFSNPSPFPVVPSLSFPFYPSQTPPTSPSSSTPLTLFHPPSPKPSDPSLRPL